MPPLNHVPSHPTQEAVVKTALRRTDFIRKKVCPKEGTRVRYSVCTIQRHGTVQSDTRVWKWGR